MFIYVILNEVKDLVPIYPDEMLHCVKYDAREICELNYDSVYNLPTYQLTKMNTHISIHFLILTTISISSYAAPKISNNAIVNVRPDSLNPHKTNISFDLDAIATAFNPGSHQNSELDLNSVEGALIAPNKSTLPMVSRFVIVPPQSAVEMFYKAESDQQGDISNLYPPSAVEMSQPFIIHGMRFVKLTAYPIQYAEDDEQFIHNRRIEVRLCFSDNEPLNPVRYPHRHKSREFREFLAAFALNSRVLERDYPPEDDVKAGHYLVATHQNCLPYIAPFIEWRRKAGYQMDILSLPDNIARNSREVKNRIQQRYDAYLQRRLDPFDQLLLVGDRSSYTWPPAAGWVLEAERGESVWAVPQHADYKYALLEGDDNYPDVGFARWCAGAPDILRMFVLRTLAYETEPYMEDTTWFRRGAAYSQHWGNNAETAWHISIATAARWAEAALRSAGFNDVRFYEDYEWDQDGRRVGEFEREVFNAKSNLMLGRAESLLWAQSLNGIEANNVFPVRIALSGHGEYATWSLLRAGAPERLKGPVVACCNWGGPPTLPTNAVWMETINGMLNYNLSYGWARTLAVNVSERYFSDFEVNSVSVYAHIKTDNDYYGDPGLKIWRSAPLLVRADYPHIISPNPRAFVVSVARADNARPVGNAIVTLYAPGNMPAFDAPAYADYNAMQSWSKKTDAGGEAFFTFDDNTRLAPNTPLYVTVTGEDIKPFFGQAVIAALDTSIRLADFDWEQVHGNGDEAINPGEQARLFIVIENDGLVNIDNLTAAISSLSPYITLAGAAQVVVGSVPRGESRRSPTGVLFNIAANCPDGLARPDLRPSLSIDLIDGRRNWLSALRLDIRAPYLTIDSNLNGRVIPEAEHFPLNIELINRGRIASPVLQARLEAFGLGIGVSRSNAVYQPIQPAASGVADGPTFLVTAVRQAAPGTLVPMGLIISSDNIIIDTILFKLQSAVPAANMPSPPDDYGYICLDDTDRDWTSAPVYEWLEINPQDNDVDVAGQTLPFIGHSPYDKGENVIIGLPFRTAFYGREVDTLTICSNGYICPGRQPRIVGFQNFPLDRGFGGAGMLAPFWDRLRWQQNSRILSYYNAEQGYFLIEWYKLRHFHDGQTDLTFQVYLYDKSKYARESGDTDILFQYKSIANIENNEPGGADIPFASVGISSPDGRNGVNYTFRNTYPITSAPLANRRALCFTTSLRNHNGVARGVVRDAASRQPIPYAVVKTHYGLLDTTDENGRYEITRLVNDLAVTLTASALLYFDTSRANIVFGNNAALEIDFELRRDLHIDSETLELPDEYGLVVFPNPFNSRLTVRFELPKPEYISIRLFDISGVETAALASKTLSAGEHRLTLPADNLPSGIYLLALDTSDRASIRKVVLIR